MPFYPTLPYDRDYINPIAAGVTGLGAGLAVGNQALKTQMYGEALAQEREKRQALKEYSQTGDVSKLMSVAPEVGYHMQEAKAKEQKVLQESIKPGLDLAYMLADGMTPENFDARRSTVVKMFPAMDAMLPRTFDDRAIQGLKQSYEKQFKLEQPTNWVYDQATDTWKQAPGAGKITVARPYEAPEEKTARRIAETIAVEDIRAQRPEKPKDLTPQIASIDTDRQKAERSIRKDYDRRIERAGEDEEKVSLLEEKMKEEIKASDAAFARKKRALQAGSGRGRQAGYDRSTFYNTFKAALAGPNRDKAIAHAQENDPEFIDRARAEGVL